MFISDFDYHLPPELIAQQPLPERDASRMMVVRRREGKIFHARFKDFPDYLDAGDVLVLNNVKVVPSKVWGRKDGRDIEFLFLKEKERGVWEVLCRPARRLKPGDHVVFGESLEADVVGAGEEGRRNLRFQNPDVRAGLRKIGFAPLPPYIKRTKRNAELRLDDLDRYQTVFAEKEGAVAAPTAGLHFTPEILSDIRQKSVEVAETTLNVGLATFQPVRAERLEDHRMLEEIYEIPAAAAEKINRAKAEGRPVVAVGTTVVRTLESAALVGKGRVSAGAGATTLFIYPGFEFKIVDTLLTNFHLPKSTLLALVSAFGGVDLIREAYLEAVRKRYRFFSYGDCMLVI